MWRFKPYFSKDDLKTLSAAIAEAEKKTSGQIRVVVRHGKHWNEKRLSLHQLALKEFHRLGMQHTRNRTGVLLLLLFSERKFHIIADEGIHKKVDDGTWGRIAEVISAHFKEGRYVQGITDAVTAVGTELAKHFPHSAGDTNELPTDVVER